MSESDEVNCCAAGCKLWRDSFVTVAHIKLLNVAVVKSACLVACANLTFQNTGNYAFAETNGGF